MAAGPLGSKDWHPHFARGQHRDRLAALRETLSTYTAAMHASPQKMCPGVSSQSMQTPTGRPSTECVLTFDIV